MAIEVFGSAAQRNLGVLDICMIFGVGAWLLWRESHQPAPGFWGYGMGAAFMLWSLYKLYQMMRPLLLRVDDSGILARRPGLPTRALAIATGAK